MSATTIVPTARSGETGKIVTAREAVRLIRTGDTVDVGGFGGIGIAEEVVHELGEIYKASDSELANFGKPGDLTLFFGVGQGNPLNGRGLNRLAQPGLVKRVIGAHFNFIPVFACLGRPHHRQVAQRRRDIVVIGVTDLNAAGILLR